MNKKSLLAIVTLLVCQLPINAQKWADMLRDTNANFYDIVREFDAYWKNKPYERGKGYKAFKRWQWFTEPRVYPSGDMRLASRAHAFEEYQKFLQANPSQRLNHSAAVSSTVANWTALGPFGSPSNTGAGRVQVIKVSPTNTSVIYVGTGAGGFWMSNNGGVSYTTTTDQLASLGVSDIAIDLINPNNIYIATGDRDAGDTHATGVLKSTNGGLTWSQTGLTWLTSQQRRIYRLLINPLNPNTLIAATSIGIYKSYNAGATWTLTQSGSFVDAEYKPNDTTVVYAVDNASVYRSANGGISFTSVSLTTAAGTLNRLSLAVTPANSAYVYVLASNNSNGFGGLYRSTNGGVSFNVMSTSPNIFDWSTNGSGSGGQGWYDIALDASPTNANEIIAGGVNSWKSVNGGTSWTLNTHWTGGGGKPYVHADLHYVMYTSGTTVYLGTDGGVARTVNSGASYQTINGNMNIAQIYKLGLSASNAGRIITGHQDNGTCLSNTTNWAEVSGGDGMDCFIDWNNNNTMVCAYTNGAFSRSINGGGSWTNITFGLTGTGAWVAPIRQDPSTPNTYYCGYQNVFKSTNQGASWSPISNFNATLDEIKISPVNSNTILASSTSAIWRTTNGGSTWSLITGIIATAGAQITDICMDNQNPNNIFATLSGYVNGNKVYKSNDGGLTWINYSNGLPNIPINCIVYVNNSAQGVYVGTDVGVYYREASMNSWVQFSNGLPNVIVDDMEIYYPTGKLRAATYGRGVWETDLYSDPLGVPVGAFYNGFSSACVNTPYVFNDASSNNPVTWNWIFTGGSPATATVQNPSVTYPTSGVYTVVLVAGNGNGMSAPYISTISVVNAPTVSPVPSSICIGQNAQIVVNSNAGNIFWSTGQIGPSIFVSPSTNAVYNFTAVLGACKTVGSNTVFVSTSIPQTPTVINLGGLLTTTTNAISFQWYLNAAAIPNATAQSIVPTQNGYYSVWVSNDGCMASSDAYLYEAVVNTTGLSQNAVLSSLQILPNPVKDELTLIIGAKMTAEIQVNIVDGLGRVVYSSQVNVAEQENRFKISTKNLSAGVYYVELKNEKGSTQYKFIKQD